MAQVNSSGESDLLEQLAFKTSCVCMYGVHAYMCGVCGVCGVCAACVVCVQVCVWRVSGVCVGHMCVCVDVYVHACECVCVHAYM